MAHILEGQVLINNTDIWNEWGVFLTEEKSGGRENLNAILSASKTKAHVGVDFRELSGKRYPQSLLVANEERDVVLYFAQYASTKSEWLERYFGFINFLKRGNNGWLNVSFPSLNLSMRMFYVSATSPKVLTYLWSEGVQAGRYKVTFREPEPII